MGIPGYTKWLRLRFSGCFHPVTMAQPLSPRPHHVHFDLAARLYLVATRAKDTPHLVRLLLRDLHGVVRWVAPRRSVTLAIDGAPPAAKLWTQRVRRFERRTAKKGRSAKRRPRIDTLSFTLGTRTMWEVGRTLRFFAVQALQARWAARTLFVVSGPDVPGEGEHKLHRRVLSLLLDKPHESHLIVGNDADLIVQAAAAAAVLEQLGDDGAASPPAELYFEQLSLLMTYQHGPTTGKPEMLRVPVADLSAAVLADLPQPASIDGPPLSAPRTMLDLALLSLLMGSDYLPRARGLRLPSTWPAYQALKQESGPQAYLVQPAAAGNGRGEFAFAVDYPRLGSLLRRATARQRGRKGDRGLKELRGVEKTLSPEEYMAALEWTLGLTANGRADARASFLPAHAPRTADLIRWLEAAPAAVAAAGSREARDRFVEPYSVALSTLPLHAAGRLLPPWLLPLQAELAAEARQAADPQPAAASTLARLGQALSRWLPWPRSAPALPQEEERLPPAAGFPSPDRLDASVQALAEARGAETGEAEPVTRFWLGRDGATDCYARHPFGRVGKGSALPEPPAGLPQQSVRVPIVRTDADWV